MGYAHEGREVTIKYVIGFDHDSGTPRPYFEISMGQEWLSEGETLLDAIEHCADAETILGWSRK